MLFGERYKVIFKEVKVYIRGEYGRLFGKINFEFVKKVFGSEKLIEGRFVDILEFIFEKIKE